LFLIVQHSQHPYHCLAPLPVSDEIAVRISQVQAKSSHEPTQGSVP